ncbi:MAG: hypothetical protein JZU65_16130 [Chlorobium sp.]|nr:hypothetical protein [Chlorobium sp.]
MPVFAGIAAIASAIVVTSVIGTVVVGVVAGAVVGAAVGAITAAVTGGDIGKGALWGAVGGAVTGGFSAYSGMSSLASPEVSLGKGVESVKTGLDTVKNIPQAASDGGLMSNMSTGAGTLGAGAIQAVGSAMSGVAQGGAAEKAAENEVTANETEFQQKIAILQKEHELRMDELNNTDNPAVEVANLNNASAQSRLAAEIAANKATVDAANARTDAQRTALNDSIAGTDPKLFNRPTFEFNPVTTGSLLDDKVA